MAARADRQSHILGAGELTRTAYVARASTSNDQRRIGVNCVIPDAAQLFVITILGQEETTLQAGCKLAQDALSYGLNTVCTPLGFRLGKVFLAANRLH